MKKIIYYKYLQFHSVFIWRINIKFNKMQKYIYRLLRFCSFYLFLNLFVYTIVIGKEKYKILLITMECTI